MVRFNFISSIQQFDFISCVFFNVRHVPALTRHKNRSCLHLEDYFLSVGWLSRKIVFRSSWDRKFETSSIIRESKAKMDGILHKRKAKSFQDDNLSNKQHWSIEIYLRDLRIKWKTQRRQNKICLPWIIYKRKRNRNNDQK